MKDKINVAELLRYCQSGMELDCSMWDNLYFDRVEDDLIHCYYELDGYRNATMFLKDGCYTAHKLSKCVIFPKGKTTWEGFVPPCQFKDGDIVASLNSSIYIFTNCSSVVYGYFFAPCGLISDRHSENHHFKLGALSISVDNMRLATEEEKQKLFDAIKANGYRWNPENKTLDKLVEPKFKVGDKVKHKCDKNNTVITITCLKQDCYYIQYFNNIKNEYQNEAISFTDQDKYELIIDKFDINTLKPFDKVLVRTKQFHDKWIIGFFSHKDSDGFAPFWTTADKNYQQCIPYEENKHLLGTTSDCKDYFKTWQNE